MMLVTLLSEVFEWYLIATWDAAVYNLPQGNNAAFAEGESNN